MRSKAASVSSVVALLALALAVAAVLSGCGGSDDDQAKAAKKQVALKAPPVPTDGRYFSADSPWNTGVQSLPASPDSYRMLSRARTRRAVIEKPGTDGVRVVTRVVRKGFAINTDRWAPLIVRAGDSGDTTEFKLVCRQTRCGPGSDLIPSRFELPSGTRPDPRYDGWLTVIDPVTRIGYDFWRARLQTDDTISYQYVKPWTLGGPGFSKPMSVDRKRAPGARGSGLPLFAGVIGPSELKAGEIDHALAISVPGLARRNYVQPASATDGVGPTNSLPAGARIRLRGFVRPDADLHGERRRAVETILVALRKYGAIVVDRAASPTLYAPKGTPPSVLTGNELDWLKLSDFEVVALPKVYKDPPLGQVEQVGTGSAPDGGQAGGGS